MITSVRNKLGIGTAQFGLNYGISNTKGVTGREEVKRILDHMRAVGIDTIDTASGYGNSEEVLGWSGVDGFKVLTKFMPENEESTLAQQIKLSLQRLKTTSLYGLLAHRPLEVLKSPRVWPYLLELKAQGIVRKIGFSFNTPEEAFRIIEEGYLPDIIQAPFNYFDKRFRDIMAMLKADRCEIHSRSAFLQGLFFLPAHELSDNFGEVRPVILELQQNGDALPGLLLKYCLKQEFIDKVIIGINNLAQLKANIKGLDNPKVLPEFRKTISSSILTPSEWPKTS